MLRCHDVARYVQEDTEVLRQRISVSYADAESSAALVMSEVEGEADLARMMQDLPAVEDLLEASGDAPIIRMINALLTQAAREGASDIHIEAYAYAGKARTHGAGLVRSLRECAGRGVDFVPQLCAIGLQHTGLGRVQRRHTMEARALCPANIADY